MNFIILDKIRRRISSVQTISVKHCIELKLRA